MRSAGHKNEQLSLRRRLNAEPRHHWLLTRLSSAYYEQRRYALALKYAEKAFAEVPSCPLVLWDYAGALQMRGRHLEALDPRSPGQPAFDTFRNLLQSPRVGLMFLIPGKRETLRIGGRAEVVRDAALLDSLTAQGKVPALAIAVHVDEAFFHCSKCMIRSHLWQHEQWPALDGLPTLAETMKDAAAIAAPVEVVDGLIKEDEEQRLY